MKRFFALCAVLAGLAAMNAGATEEDKNDNGTFNPKKCFKLCMKEIDDRDKCTYICDPSIDPRK